MTMAADIAAIATDVKWIRENAEKAAVREEKLEARVTELEKGRIRTSAWAAGFGAAAAFVFSIVKDKLVAVLLAAFLGSCVMGCAQDAPPGATSWWHANLKPVPVILHEDMRPECADAALQAVEFWKKTCGIDWLKPKVVDAGWSGWEGESAPFGRITMQDAPNDEGALATTRSSRVSHRRIAARIKFSPTGGKDVCTPHVAAHELGHALGLDDRREAEDIDLLMFWAFPGFSMDRVEPRECDWVDQ